MSVLGTIRVYISGNDTSKIQRLVLMHSIQQRTDNRVEFFKTCGRDWSTIPASKRIWHVAERAKDSTVLYLNLNQLCLGDIAELFEAYRTPRSKYDPVFWCPRRNGQLDLSVCLLDCSANALPIFRLASRGAPEWVEAYAGTLPETWGQVDHLDDGTRVNYVPDQMLASGVRRIVIPATRMIRFHDQKTLPWHCFDNHSPQTLLWIYELLSALRDETITACDIEKSLEAWDEVIGLHPDYSVFVPGSLTEKANVYPLFNQIKYRHRPVAAHGKRIAR
jgi:hypothetical protein